MLKENKNNLHYKEDELFQSNHPKKNKRKS